jgi:acyl dehydratase
MSTVVVRYTPKPERADENQQLVEAVFADLAETDPGGLRYATFRLADGTFVHIADIEGDENPLAASAAFAAFQENIGDRCAEGDGPNPQAATLVGSYRFLAT